MRLLGECSSKIFDLRAKVAKLNSKGEALCHKRDDVLANFTKVLEINAELLAKID